MNEKILLIILIFFCAENVFAQKENVDVDIVKTEKEAPEIAQLKKVIHRFDNALKTANIEELKSLLSDKLEMIHPNGMVETKETLLKNIETKKLIYWFIEQVGEAEVKHRYLGKKPGYLYDIERKLNVRIVLDGAGYTLQLMTVEQWREWKGDWKLIKRESKNRG